MPTPDNRRRLVGLADDARTDPGFRVWDKTEPTGKSATAEPSSTRIDIYSEIGGFGVWPDEFKGALDTVEGDVELHIHSPGGDAFDGIAIYNMLRQHDGNVNVTVDGLAASAASVVAMAGANVTMSRGAQMMVHDAWGLSMGGAEDMSRMLDTLNKTSDSIAAIYAHKAGGSETDWRAAMKAETWYRDTEAVDAGLADQVETATAAAKNRWDLKVFAYAGRDAAPDPVFPAGHRATREPEMNLLFKPGALDASKISATIMAAAERAKSRPTAPAETTGAAISQIDKEAAAVPNAELIEKIKSAFEVNDEAAGRFAAFLYPEAGSTTTTAVETPQASAETEPSAKLPKATKAAEAVMLDPTTLAQLQAQARLGVEAHNEMKKQKRDRILDAAMERGKFPPSRREHYQMLYDSDPDGTVELLDRIPENIVPVEVLGYSGEIDAMRSESDRAYLGLYGKEG